MFLLRATARLQPVPAALPLSPERYLRYFCHQPRYHPAYPPTPLRTLQLPAPYRFPRLPHLATAHLLTLHLENLATTPPLPPTAAATITADSFATTRTVHCVRLYLTFAGRSYNILVRTLTDMGWHLTRLTAAWFPFAVAVLLAFDFTTLYVC